MAACGSSSPTTSINTSGTSTGAGSSTPYTVNFGFINTTATMTGPWGYAYSKGLLQKWLKADGVTLNLSHFANGPLLTAAMIGGSVDLGVLGDTPGLIAKSQGLPAQFVDQPELDLVAWIVAQPPIHSVTQLAGKTVAVQQGSYLDRYLQGLLVQDGLINKVHRVAMLSAESTPAFEAGSLDAILSSPTQWPLLAKTGKRYNVIAKSEITPSLEGTQVTVATNKILAAHPDIASIWNSVRVKSIQYAEANATAYYQWAAVQGNTTAATEEEAAPLSSYPTPNFTAAGISQLQGTLNFLVSQKEATPFSLQAWEVKSS
ncbi:MAG TPA: ABC transporter substrate-binding protein [Solirubrobacteraceae bacterium]|nr:ABC transporter substrate-binding protein [Solirubrobacteraceae bacterium]